MKAGAALFVALIAILGISWTPAQADLYDFTIRGTYDETLTSPDGSVTLFSAGDAFTIQGTYDTDLPAVVETKANGDVTLTGFSKVYPSIGYRKELTYAGITALTLTGMDLDLINQYYPSDGSANNNGDPENGAYTTDYIYEYAPASSYRHQFNVQAYDTYTNLYARKITTNGVTAHAAWIDYDYRLKTIPSGAGTITRAVHDTIDLNIDSFEMTEHVVPLPGSAVLLASAMATVFGMRKRLRA